MIRALPVPRATLFVILTAGLFLATGLFPAADPALSQPTFTRPVATTPPPASPGACCIPTGGGSRSCSIQYQNVCNGAGGTFHGQGSSCTAGLCPSACCLPDDSCQILDGTGCSAVSGTYQGGSTGGVDCTPDPCIPPTQGACCLSDGSCTVTDQASCNATGGLGWRSGEDCFDYDGDGLVSACELDDCSAWNGKTSGTDPDDWDTDDDGLSDGDEILGTAGGLDLAALGADPLHADIFLEIDWFNDDNGTHSHQPASGAVTDVVSAFAQAPWSLCGNSGIALHVADGRGGSISGGNLIGNQSVVGWQGEFNTFKGTHLAANRHGFFHYALFAHHYNSSGNFSSGVAEICGDDLMVTLQFSDTRPNEARTAMHELGHNLSLLHGGLDATNFKPNYNSVMNYRYQFPGADNDCDALGDGILDYSRGANITLNENSLSEPNGVCGSGTVAIDWNGNGSSNQTGLAWNINCRAGFLDIDGCGGSSEPQCGDNVCGVLLDFDDWANARLDCPPGLLPPESIECQPAP